MRSKSWNRLVGTIGTFALVASVTVFSGVANALNPTWHHVATVNLVDGRGISCPSTTQCELSVLHKTIKTTNGGTTWVSQVLPAVSPSSSYGPIACPSVLACVVKGGTPVVIGPVTYYKPFGASTNNGGAIWHADSETGNLYEESEAVTCATTLICVSVGYINPQNAFLSRSTDGGAIWSDELAPISLAHSIGDLSGVSCPTAVTCYAVGIAGEALLPLKGVIIRSTNAGATWTALASPGPGEVHDISCATTLVCVAYESGSFGGWLLRTTNGGASWLHVHPPAGLQVNALSCRSTSTCEAVMTSASHVPIFGSLSSSLTFASQYHTTISQSVGLSCATATVCFGATVSGVSPNFTTTIYRFS